MVQLVDADRCRCLLVFIPMHSDVRDYQRSHDSTQLRYSTELMYTDAYSVSHAYADGCIYTLARARF